MSILVTINGQTFSDYTKLIMVDSLNNGLVVIDSYCEAKPGSRVMVFSNDGDNLIFVGDVFHPITNPRTGSSFPVIGCIYAEEVC